MDCKDNTEIERLRYYEIIHRNLTGGKNAKQLLDLLANNQLELEKCRELLRRFLPKDETEWDKIIQLTQTEKDVISYFRGING